MINQNENVKAVCIGLIKIIMTLKVKYLQKALTSRRVPEAKQSIIIIVQQFLKYSKTAKSNNKYSLTCQLILKILKGIKMRLFHVPVQYVVPYWYFRNLRIKLAPPLLVPRFQTQYFVSLMIQRIRIKWPKGSHLKMADLCCGSGVIGLSILRQLQNIYDIQMIFLDISQKATEYTKINREINKLSKIKCTIITGNLLQHLNLINQCQVVVSNPPYIPAHKYRKLQKQIKLFEDKQALVSGQQGLDLVEPLAKAIGNLRLSRSGFIAGIQYDGQSVAHLNMEQYVVKDQYSKRRYLIFD